MLHFHFYMVKFHGDGSHRLIRVPVVAGKSPYMPEIMDTSGRWIAPAFIGEYTIVNEVFPTAPITSALMAMAASGHDSELAESVLASGDPIIDIVLTRATPGQGVFSFPVD